MKRLTAITFILLSLSTGFLPAQTFETNFEQAQQLSQTQEKPILMVFSGSDWCKPCILLKQEVLAQETFAQFSQDHLVVVNLDFPFRKKNKLAPALQQQNDALAESYNPKGTFPLVLLLNQDLSVAETINYKPGMAPEAFVQSIAASISK